MIARPGRSPRPARADGLREQLVGPLGRALVGKVEGDVGGDDPDERDLRNVEPLGHQARADQHVQPAFGEGVEDALHRALVLGHVAVQAADAEVRENGPDLLLDALVPPPR